jgi:hypothetical protein
MNASGVMYLTTNESRDSLSLVINTSGTNNFSSGSVIIFSGENGSDLSVGSAGGNAGVINWSATNLFNTKNIISEGLGGSSTLAGVNGGNGGILQLNYRGLDGYKITPGFEDRVYLTGGWNLTGTQTGINGSIIYKKSLLCSPKRDADINDDGVINGDDRLKITGNYNNASGNSGYNESYDANCDGNLNVEDLARVGFEYRRGT